MKENLLNIGNEKTIKTINYIRGLLPREVEFDAKRFYKIIKEALSKVSANNMLKEIGFNPLGEDNIYNVCSKRK